MRSRKGFTLIELLVVAAIISVLTAVVLANLNTARIKGRNARRVGDLKQLQQAVENYFENNSSYPNGAGASTLNVLTQAPNKILPAIPKDPLGYDYCYSGGATAYCIGVNFEGGPPASLPPTTNCTILQTPPNICNSNYKVGDYTP